MAGSPALMTALSIAPVVPVITIERAEDAVPLAGALARGGLTVLEVTLRTRNSLEAIREMRKALPEIMVGAGTVTTSAHVQLALEAGAQFLVSPGVSPGLLPELLAAGVPVLPGVATASEAMARTEEGFEIVKLFPAVPIGGLALLKSIAAPLPHIRFMPTGGITEAAAPDFLALPNVVAVGGSWMVDKADLDAADWGAVEAKARAASRLRKPAPAPMENR